MIGQKEQETGVEMVGWTVWYERVMGGGMTFVRTPGITGFAIESDQRKKYIKVKGYTVGIAQPNRRLAGAQDRC